MGTSGGVQLEAREECGERLENGGEARRVIRTRERQFFADHALRAELGDDAVDFGGRPGEDDLVGAVIDGDHNRRAGRPAGRLGPLAIGPGGDQAGGGDCALRFQLAEDRGEPAQLPLEVCSVRQRARGRERRAARRCCGRRPRQDAGPAASVPGRWPTATRARR